MAISYRTRRSLRNLGIGLLIFALLLVLVWIIWLLWLDRYVVYTRDGVKLDFSQSVAQISGEPAVRPNIDVDIPIYYNEGDQALVLSTELAQLGGFYVTRDMLIQDISGIETMLRKLPPQTPIMIEMKDIVGRYFYDTSLGPIHKEIDQVKMDRLIKYLTASDHYVIARVPALRDYYYGLNNVSDGLPTAGGYLWMESGTNCYWLNPASEGTRSYLMQTAKELQVMGFNEVVFSDFRFPDTDRIVFKGNKKQALEDAAKELAEASAAEHFAISFLVEDAAFALPAGRTRMYLEGQSASNAKALADKSGLEDPKIRLVFVSDVNDTRFDEYSVLRPITSAELD